jgi:hypothetical protein
MQAESQKNMHSEHPPSAITVELDRLEPIQHEPSTLSKLLCLQHIRTVGHYLINGVNSTKCPQYRWLSAQIQPIV